MSSAFVRESDEDGLDEIGAGMNYLIAYLTRHNNGIRVYEKKNYFDKKSEKVIHEMSNGLSYALSDDNKWFVVMEEE
jgi:hypothetical protein